MQSGRLERRMAMSGGARLAIPGEPAVFEPVAIENISLHGARVVANRSCLVDDSVVITDLLGGARLDARVIYCESLSDGRCAIGLQFNEAAALSLG
jgi:PilZ domain